MEIKKQLVGEPLASRMSFGKGNPRKWITVHQTANTSRGANAQAHANLQSRGNSRQCSWHWSVDDHQAIQSFDHAYRCWHAGDGRGAGNTQSIGVEICINSDGDYKASVRNGARLVAKIAKEEGIGLDHIVQHHHWSGKDCPHEIRAGLQGVTWPVFMSWVKADYNGGSVASSPAPSALTTSSGELYRVQVGAYRDKSNAQAVASKLHQAGYDTIIKGEGKQTSSTLKADPAKASGFLKYEKATYIPYTLKNVRSAPSASSEIVAQYPAGSHIAYDEVYDGDGYRWVSYIDRSGNRRYVACRRADGTALGKFE